MASSCNQRHSVVWLNCATKPLWQTCRVSSAKLQRESGRACWAGGSHARALTCTTSSGGKRPGPTRSGTFFQARQAFLKEALAPKADDLPPRNQAFSDLIIRQTLGRMENHSGTNHLKIR